MTNDTSSDEEADSDSKYPPVNRGDSNLPPDMTHSKMARLQGFDTHASPEARGYERAAEYAPDPEEE